MTHVTAGTAGRTRSGRVLVVDDSDELVRLVAAWLEDDGYLVTTATTGARALAAATAELPDVVLLDLILPPPDGFTVCRALRTFPRPPAVVVMTGLSDENRLRDLDGLGAVAVLRKPLTEESVLDAVSRARRHVEARRKAGAI